MRFLYSSDGMTPGDNATPLSAACISRRDVRRKLTFRRSSPILARRAIRLPHTCFGQLRVNGFNVLAVPNHENCAPFEARNMKDLGMFKLDDPPPVSRNVLPLNEPRSSLNCGVNAPTLSADMRALLTVQRRR